ncbi:hypothetical protein [Undibacterium sp. RuTC16W]|uniref:hypothetical protein n=1 Tax=Undibacterium sp. RuTC16W TaxID=3413048 RepID=UPI003BF019B7
MKPWLALLLTLLLLVGVLLASALAGFNLTWLMILVTALWASIDSSKLRLNQYKSGISYSPPVLFIAIAFFWIVGFPWYLIVRYKVKNGTAVMKDGVAANAT